MFIQLKNAFWAFCLLACFPLYALGQLLLLIYNNNHQDFYIGLSKFSASWINTHLILMLSLLLMIPAYLAIGTYLKNRNFPIWFGLSFLFLILSIFVMFGQFTIDLCLVEIAKLPKPQATFLIEKIQSNSIIEPLFYDNSKILVLFKYLDFWFLSQIFLAAALLSAGKLPKWELAIFFTALIITQLGPLIDPFYGRVLKRLGYALFSFAYIPIAIDIYKNKKSKSSSNE